MRRMKKDNVCAKNKYTNKKAEDSDYGGEDSSEDEDEDDEDEDEGAKEKLPPTQIAVIAKNKKGRQNQKCHARR